jgi:hypothetical protein
LLAKCGQKIFNMLRKITMSSEAIATVVKMMGTMPDATQNQVVEYLQTYIADLQDEQRWDEAYAKTQTN